MLQCRGCCFLFLIQNRMLETCCDNASGFVRTGRHCRFKKPLTTRVSAVPQSNNPPTPVPSTAPNIAMSSSQVIASPSLLPSSSHIHPPQMSNHTGGYQYDPYDNPRTPRRTPMACQFCRGAKHGYKPLVAVLMLFLGRKLKCGTRFFAAGTAFY